MTFKNRPSRKESQIRQLAASIPDQATLDRILDDCKPGMRGAVLEKIRPFLGFEVAEA